MMAPVLDATKEGFIGFIEPQIIRDAVLPQLCN
jgi:hypothetical protein